MSAESWLVSALIVAGLGLAYFALVLARRVPVSLDATANGAVVLGALAVLLSLIRV